MHLLKFFKSVIDLVTKLKTKCCHFVELYDIWELVKISNPKQSCKDKQPRNLSGNDKQPCWLGNVK